MLYCRARLAQLLGAEHKARGDANRCGFCELPECRRSLDQ